MMHHAMRLRAVALATACLTATACADRTDESAVQDTGVAIDSPAVAQTPAQQGAALFNPETATREELRQIPNMSEEIVDALIAGRPYSDMLAVDQVLAAHLDDDQRRAVYRSMFKPMDLNNATREEILLIPDVDPRMPHEFDEYRPYTDIEEFRREIGKYVSAEEVARYEKYVEIR
jgi:hypothetical protein